MSDLIDRAQAMTELQTNAKRLTLAYEAHGEGRVEYSDIIVRLSDALDVLRGLLSAEPTYNDGDIQKMQDLEQAQLEKAYQLGYEEGKKDAQPEERTGKRTETRACDSIRRQDAIDALIRKMKPHDNGDGTMTIYVMPERLVKETLNDLLVAQQKRCEDCENFSKTRSLIPQPERKSGGWIFGEDDGGQYGWTCSECGFFIPWYYDYYGLNNIDFIRDFHTCPHCDAMMLTYTGKERGGA